MYWQLVADYKNGDHIILCTAREMGNGIMNIYTQWVFITIGFIKTNRRRNCRLETKRKLLTIFQFKTISEI